MWVGSAISTFCIGLGILGTLATVQAQNYAAVDAHVRQIRLDHSDVALLAREVTAISRTELERVRAIYQFLVYHISYDQEAYREDRRRINQSGQDVLRRGQAVCWGYAKLFEEMCGHLGIAASVVSGYTLTEEKTALGDEPDHTWNAVRVDSAWYLLDATWGAGMPPGDESDRYFLVEPTIFIQDHLPSMPMWQLLTCPVDAADFVAGNLHVDSTDCGYAFDDSISVYLQLSKLEQLTQASIQGYQVQPSGQNYAQWGHALIDLAIERKEQGDEAMGLDHLEQALGDYTVANQLFDQADDMVDFYPWQQEAYAFASLNRAQVMYQLWEPGSSADPIVRQFENAKIQLAKLSGPVVAHSMALIDQYLSALQ